MPFHRLIPAILILLAMLAPSIPLASAQSFGDQMRKVAERAARQEVSRKVDQTSRQVTRCVLGDDRCAAEARQRGEAVEVVDDQGRAVADQDPGGDHPLITPYAGSVLEERRFEAYAEYLRVVGREGGRSVTQRLEGRLTRLRYENPGGRSTFEIIRNYRDALEKRGLRADYECSRREQCGNTAKPSWQSLNGINLGVAGDVRYLTGVLRDGGGDAYVAIAVNPNVTYVHVLEAARMDRDMVSVDAAAMAAGLDKDGRITLQGIYFDTGAATLTPASNPALDQVAQLMREQPDLRLLVAGHTDATGGAENNQRLSQARAEAVRNALLSRGVPAVRLAAQGMGSSVPVADEGTEQGRALNRRVELVRQ